MNNGTLILTILIITICIVVIIQLFIYKRKKDHKKSIENEWNNFIKSIHLKHLHKVYEHGICLIYNEYFSLEKLEKMNLLLDELNSNSKEVKELKKLLYNKRLNWNSKEYISKY